MSETPKSKLEETSTDGAHTEGHANTHVAFFLTPAAPGFRVADTPELLVGTNVQGYI